MSVQRKRRRGTASNNASFTGAEGEFVYVTDTKRIAAHDGTTAGGTLFLNAGDVQNNVGKYATVGGTANAITLTNSSAPVKAYTAGLEVVFKPTANNTGAVTLTVDGLGGGAKALEKMVSGTLTALAADDLRTGAVVTAIYDGTKFQLQGGQGSGVTQGTITVLSGSSVVLDVDFTTYSAYELLLPGITDNTTNDIKIDVSSDGGSTYATVTRHYKNFSSSTFSTVTTQEISSAYANGATSSGRATISQATTTSFSFMSFDFASSSGAILGMSAYQTSAAINKIRIQAQSGGTLSGRAILIPISKR